MDDRVHVQRLEAEGLKKKPICPEYLVKRHESKQYPPTWWHLCEGHERPPDRTMILAFGCDLCYVNLIAAVRTGRWTINYAHGDRPNVVTPEEALEKVINYRMEHGLFLIDVAELPHYEVPSFA